jgi:ribonuclease D
VSAGPTPSTPTGPPAAAPALPPPPIRPVEWVSTPTALATAARTWQQRTWLALDTEFVRERTFYSKLGLVQVGDAERVWLVDPLALPAPRDLGAALAATPARWVVHSASEDLEVMGRVLDFRPHTLFDTQIAAALCGVGAALSLQKLTALVLGWDLPKGETRTDWLARPLSPAQLAYAAEDVVPLVPLAEELERRLRELGRTAWCHEDCERLCREAAEPNLPQDAWQRVKGAGRFNPRQLGALSLLAAWRELEARRRDLPRGFVLRDEALLALAARLPENGRELFRVPGVDPRQLSRDGAQWLEVLRRARELPDGALPSPRPTLPPSSRAVEDSLRELVRQRAEALALAPEVLAPRRLLGAVLEQAYFRTEPSLPSELEGWRRAAIGEELLALAVAGVRGARGGR